VPVPSDSTHRVPIVVALALLAGGGSAPAQELEPKAYAASPVGTTFVVIGLARSTGSVVFDPTVPVTDVEARVSGSLIGAGYTFGLFGKLALVTATLPYTWGDISGKVGEEARAITRSGLADSRMKFSVNFVGNPAMPAREFAKTERRTIVGASLTAVVPTGQYDPAKLINLGTNRWAFKPEVGVAVPRGRWDFDGYVGVWLFSANPDFYPGGLERTQEPVVAAQVHASYTFRPRLWAAVNATWYRGGSTRAEGGEPSAGVNNSRLGATVSLPLGRFQSFKVAYSSGVSVRTGTDFRTLAVGWQWVGFTKL
jgi:hypothetical protein